MISILKSFFQEHAAKEAIIWNDQPYTYQWLMDQMAQYQAQLEERFIHGGDVVVIASEYHPCSIAMFFALMENACIVVPLTSQSDGQLESLSHIAEAEKVLRVQEGGEFSTETLHRQATSQLILELRKLKHPGLILFSSGSSGVQKGVVHDFSNILNKFKVKRYARRSILFMMFDHIGGINTLLYLLTNGGCAVIAQSLDPISVMRLVETHSVDMLPTTPSFLTMLLLSEEYRNHNLSSLKTITYGAESMSPVTLRKLNEVFPSVDFVQTYGLSEIGILRSKSKDSGSLWVKIGGEQFQTRVVDGILQIKAESAMLGYLNAPSPFTSDGWFITGDAVEQDGEYFKILGRATQTINVGGQKVNPIEVESVIQEMDQVGDVTVYGEPIPLLGNIVRADIQLKDPNTDQKKFMRDIKLFCKGRLEEYKIPVRVKLVTSGIVTNRFKKLRSRT